MKLNIQIKSILGKVLFEFEKEDNTIKDTVIEFLKKNEGEIIRGVDLSGLNLSGVSFYNSRFDNSSFYNSSFDNSSFYNSSFDNSRFDNSSFYNSSFYNSRFYNSRFDNSRFDNSSFYNSSFYNSSFDNKCTGVDIIIAQSRILPDGDLIGWKKCRDNVIVKMLIPAKAKRSNAFGRKCRAEYVKVLEVIGAKVGIGQHDGKTKYIKGKITRCHEWDDNFQKECSGGIHFFITKLEAERY